MRNHSEIEVGKVYEGKVVRIVDFGAFVNLIPPKNGKPGKDGLVHISQIADHRIGKVSDVLSVDQMVRVKVLEIDRQGKIRLSIKEAREAAAGG